GSPCCRRIAGGHDRRRPSRPGRARATTGRPPGRARPRWRRSFVPWLGSDAPLALWDDAAMTISGGGSDQQAGRTGLALRDPLPWTQLRHVVETAEDTGYEAVFVPEIAGRESFSTLAAFAEVTSRMMLGTGVVSVRSRSP